MSGSDFSHDHDPLAKPTRDLAAENADLKRKLKEIDKLRRRVAELSAAVMRGDVLKRAEADLQAAAAKWQKACVQGADPLLENYALALVQQGLSVDQARLAVQLTAEMVFAAAFEWTQNAVARASVAALAEINKANAGMGVELRPE